MWTGERQTTRMRIEYLEAALNQDIQYFDTEVRTSDVVFGINTDAVMVQDAISEKVGKKHKEKYIYKKHSFYSFCVCLCVLMFCSQAQLITIFRCFFFSLTVG